MAKNNTKAFSAELLDQLLAGRDPKTVLDSGGLRVKFRDEGLVCNKAVYLAIRMDAAGLRVT